ncbi:MAG TPA: fumarylacetoacetate hydrolase family protein [Steroidobacter sp.]|uniref:fumarylacetoacetate hydrolase family protein n=1 Tax=Steroidobacter sp. TaxID=1978227 RepID=UPI002ED999FD
MLAHPALLNPLLTAGVPEALQAMGLSGVVYGVLANDPAWVESLGATVNARPYMAPPQAPVLYLKPRNTLATSGHRVVLARDEVGYEVGACLGMVIGSTACRVSREQALDHLAGYITVADLSLPQKSYYRPNLRFKARDGSCVIGPRVTPAASISTPDELSIRVLVHGSVVQTTSTAGRTRSAAQLIADVTAFMTLRPGDVLLLGASYGAPVVRAGQRFKVEIDGLDTLTAEVEHDGEIE